MRCSCCGAKRQPWDVKMWTEWTRAETAAHRQRRVTGGMSRGVFSFVFVVVQWSAEESGLDLRTLSTNQMPPAVALAAFHHAPLGTEGKTLNNMLWLSFEFPSYTDIYLKNIKNINLYLLLKAPPKSQSHGRHPARSLLSPQYSGCGREIKLDFRVYCLLQRDSCSLTVWWLREL